MTALTDEVVLVIIAGPYLLLGFVTGYVFGLRRRVKKLERVFVLESAMEEEQWRER